MNKERILKKLWLLEQLIGCCNFSVLDNEFDTKVRLAHSQKDVHRAYDVIIDLIKEVNGGKIK